MPVLASFVVTSYQTMRPCGLPNPRCRSLLTVAKYFRWSEAREVTREVGGRTKLATLAHRRGTQELPPYCLGTVVPSRVETSVSWVPVVRLWVSGRQAVDLPPVAASILVTSFRHDVRRYLPGRRNRAASTDRSTNRLLGPF